MEQLKCLSCGHLNAPGNAVCRECGQALTGANTGVVEEVPYVAPPSDTVVVQRTGMSQTAMLAASLFGLAAIVLVGVVMYQWGRSDDAEEDLARTRATRSERADRDNRPTTSTTSYPPPTAPPPATTSQAPVIVPVPVPSTSPSLAPSAVPSTRTRDEGVSTYIATVDPLLEDWTELRTTAETQTGDELKQTIGLMRDIQKRATQVKTPAAAGTVQGRMLTAMTAIIEALQNGSPGGGFPTSSEAYRQASELFDKFQSDYDALKISQ